MSVDSFADDAVFYLACRAFSAAGILLTFTRSFIRQRTHGVEYFYADIWSSKPNNVNARKDANKNPLSPFELNNKKHDGTPLIKYG